jgi:hypothetical protein
MKSPGKNPQILSFHHATIKHGYEFPMNTAETKVITELMKP